MATQAEGMEDRRRDRRQDSQTVQGVRHAHPVHKVLPKAGHRCHSDLGPTGQGADREALGHHAVQSCVRAGPERHKRH